MARRGPSTSPFQLEGRAPAMQTLAAGDLQIFNEDSTVDVILAGDRLSAGLSPRKLQDIRDRIARSAEKDTAGLGGSISKIVKSTVADKLSLRAVYPLSEIDELRYDDGRILIRYRGGGKGMLLGDDVKIEGDRDANRFRREDAERLIAAVQARRR